MADAHPDDDVGLTPARRLALGLALGLSAVLAAAILSLPADRPSLADLAVERTPDSGILNPVTAVLLNFRGYDTLLEVAVLLLAVIGMWSIARHARIAVKTPDTPVLSVFVRLLLPGMTVVAGYLLWLGADAPGGAFQGGSILGGMGVLWVAAAVWLPGRRLYRLLRPALIAGLAVFIAVAAGLMLLGGMLLEYPAGQAKAWILVVESAAIISIGITLTLLFIGGLPAGQGE